MLYIKSKTRIIVYEPYKVLLTYREVIDMYPYVSEAAGGENALCESLDSTNIQTGWESKQCLMVEL